MPKHVREELTGRVGAKDRATNRVAAEVVESTDKDALQEFVTENTDPDATVYTDDASAYEGLPRNRESVKHSVGEYVRGMAVDERRGVVLVDA